MLRPKAVNKAVRLILQGRQIGFLDPFFAIFNGVGANPLHIYWSIEVSVVRVGQPIGVDLGASNPRCELLDPNLSPIFFRNLKSFFVFVGLHFMDHIRRVAVQVHSKTERLDYDLLILLQLWDMKRI